MKENDYINNLFSSSSNESDENEHDFPLVDAPPQLKKKLYDIAEVSSSQDIAGEKSECWYTNIFALPRVASVAACVLVMLVGFQYYQQQKMLGQFNQAQEDLATAVYYLNEATRITRTEVLASFQPNLKQRYVNIPAASTDSTVSPNDRSPEKECWGGEIGLEDIDCRNTNEIKGTRL